MKKIVTILLLTSTAITSAWASVQGDVPFLDSEIAVGRIKFRESISGDLLFVPALLSQRFFCNAQSRVCTLEIFNRMSEIEEEGVGKIRANGRNTSSFRLDGVQDGLDIKTEDVVGEIRSVLPNFTTPRNLMLLENPYASAVFKLPAGVDPNVLAGKYSSSGLGEMVTRYRLHGAIRRFSIRVPMRTLEEMLAKSIGSSAVTFEELKGLIRSNLEEVAVVGYTMDDAVVIVAEHLKETFLKASRKQRLKADLNKIARFRERSESHYWVLGETLVKGVQTCSVTLPIKKDAEMKEFCEVEYEAE